MRDLLAAGVAIGSYKLNGIVHMATAPLERQHETRR